MHPIAAAEMLDWTTPKQASSSPVTNPAMLKDLDSIRSLYQLEVGGDDRQQSRAGARGTSSPAHGTAQRSNAHWMNAPCPTVARPGRVRDPHHADPSGLPVSSNRDRL
jgi:hypothetical protein